MSSRLLVKLCIVVVILQGCYSLRSYRHNSCLIRAELHARTKSAPAAGGNEGASTSSGAVKKATTRKKKVNEPSDAETVIALESGVPVLNPASPVVEEVQEPVPVVIAAKDVVFIPTEVQIAEREAMRQAALERAKEVIESDEEGLQLTRVLAGHQLEAGAIELAALQNFRLRKAQELAERRGIEMEFFLDSQHVAAIPKARPGRKKLVADSAEPAAEVAPYVPAANIVPEDIYEKVLAAAADIVTSPGKKPANTYISFCSIARPLVKAMNTELSNPEVIAVIFLLACPPLSSVTCLPIVGAR